jgi:hypothetical protein
MLATTAATLPNFEPLTSQISLYTPTDASPGELVILCTWLGAQRKHITKYTPAYHTIAPHARILLIESDVRSITSSYPSQRKAIIPAVEVVLSTLSQCGTRPEKAKILLHTFSNGGPNSATQLLIVLQERTGTPTPLIGILCDSGPAAGEYWRNHNAMLLSLPPGIARIIGIPVMHFILVGLAFSVWLGRFEKLEKTIRETLLSEKFVVGRNKISYVYSKADEMTWWEDVVGHAEMARRKGWRVEEWEVEGTGHCGHWRGHEEEYTGRMRGLWEGREMVQVVK